ncbi:hypothetical protein LXL04_031253 [Taraxacum kok-saghyz]
MKLCSPLGKVADVYFARRKDASGAFFGFVRFSNLASPEETEEKMGRLELRGRKLTVNISKHPRSTPAIFKRPPAPRAPCSVPAPKMDGRSFADAAKGGAHHPEKVKRVEPMQPAMSLTCFKDIQDWADMSSIVGEAKSFDMLCNFPSLFMLEGFDVTEIKYIGGLQVALKFKSERVAANFKANKILWLKWFAGVDQLGKNTVRFERIAWVKIIGVPLVAWDESSFESIAGNFGKILVNINSFWNSSDLSHGKVCILTAQRKLINEELTVLVEGAPVKIGIFEVEDDWVPFKPFLTASQEDSDDEDDRGDGVSDTFEAADMELEDGEIDPAEGSVAGDNAKVESEGVRDAPMREDCNDSPREVGSGVRVSPQGDGQVPNFLFGYEGNQENVRVNYLPVGPLPPLPKSPCGPVSPVGLVNSPKFVNNNSSPEFGPGESKAKRRKFKIKKKSTTTNKHHSAPVNSLPSVGSSDFHAQITNSTPIPLSNPNSLPQSILTELILPIRNRATSAPKGLRLLETRAPPPAR